jgi:hypothetical protein
MSPDSFNAACRGLSVTVISGMKEGLQFDVHQKSITKKDHHSALTPEEEEHKLKTYPV